MHRDGAGGRRGGGGDPKVKSLSIPFTRMREKKLGVLYPLLVD